jgi:hypothetical protein
MHECLETMLRSRGASEALITLLAQEGMLNTQRLSAVARSSLKAQSLSTGASLRGRTRRDRSQPGRGRLNAHLTDGPPEHLEVLAAIALSYL